MITLGRHLYLQAERAKVEARAAEVLQFVRDGDSRGASTKEVQTHFGITNRAALRYLHISEGRGLIERTRPGMSDWRSRWVLAGVQLREIQKVAGPQRAVPSVWALGRL